MSNQLEQLKKVTQVVADTGDIGSIQKYTPLDATTNPSLIFKAAQLPQYEHLVEDAIAYGVSLNGKDKLGDIVDRLAVNFGKEISKIVPGVVSTEVDSRLSFDYEATLAKARKIIAMYKEVGVDKSRILIKIASTWEGIQAAKVLEKEGIRCNMTLLFSMAQAIACAEADAFLISPFVGRIMDWYKLKEGKTGYEPSADPGVKSVTDIYNYYKAVGCKTVVMGASFRNKGEILELAGCDKLTIGPKFLAQLQDSKGSFVRRLDYTGKVEPWKAYHLDEKNFRWLMNGNPMAIEKLAEGIRKFAIDTVKLEKLIASKVPSAKL